MSDKINIAIIGAGQTGAPLIENLANSSFVEIVSIADLNQQAPGIIFAKERGIPVTSDYRDVVKLGKQVDIIIEVTGVAQVKKSLKEFMQVTGNKHTVIMHELIAVLMMSMAQGNLVDTFHGFQQYN